MNNNNNKKCEAYVHYNKTCGRVATCYAVHKHSNIEHSYCNKHAPNNVDVIIKLYDKIEWWFYG